jgi:pimeloyl-ACP methyl ester carboxylesterase
MQALYYRNRLAEPFRIAYLLSNVSSSQLRSRVRESIRSEAALVQHSYAFKVLMPALYASNPFDLPLSPDIAAKTIIVSGSSDRIVGAHGLRALHSWHPSGMVSAQNSGHLVHIEALPEIEKALQRLHPKSG